MASPLLHFLANSRSAVLRPSTLTSTHPPTTTLVLGNPSCDLDSFISATVYSYFRSRPSKNSTAPNLHIPLLNLPSTPSNDLWRLRPEFGTALRLALRDQQQPPGDGRAKDEDGDDEKELLENLLTVSDIRALSSSRLKLLFSASDASTTQIPSEKTDVVLVDHNALSIPDTGIPHSLISSRLRIVGCIDHHVDESAIPPSADPRIIRTGIGSCTSLVVQYLRDEGLWKDLLTFIDESENEQSDSDGVVAATELAKLSLASILIDTANLTAEGKVSDLDREIVDFLENIVVKSESPGTKEMATQWDRKAFYHEIAESKANSLSLLTLPEIFERDYKSWSEKPASGTGNELKLGIASVVKPITWLIQKADSSAEKLYEAMRHFAMQGQEEEEGLDIFAITTTSTSDKGEFQRELLILSVGEEARKVVSKFEETYRQELKLKEWSEDQELVSLLEEKDDHPRSDIQGKIWWQIDLGKSRKQVAPLMREAMRSVSV